MLLLGEQASLSCIRCHRNHHKYRNEEEPLRSDYVDLVGNSHKTKGLALKIKKKGCGLVSGEYFTWWSKRVAGGPGVVGKLDLLSEEMLKPILGRYDQKYFRTKFGGSWSLV